MPQEACNGCGTPSTTLDSEGLCIDCTSEAQEGTSAEVLECPACGAELTAEQNFCESCGQDPNQSVASGLREHERPAVMREFAKAKSIVSVMQKIFWAGVVLDILAVLLEVATGFRGLDGVDEETRTGVIVVYLGIAALLIAIQIAGALFVKRFPLLWCVLGALTHTAITTIIFLTTGVSLPAIIRATISLAYWGGVARAMHLERLLREHKELRQAYFAPVKRGSSRGGPRTLQGKRRASKKRPIQKRTVVIIGGMVVVVALLILAALHFTKGSNPIEGHAESFRSAWNRNAQSEILSMVDSELRSKFQARFEKRLRERGWEQGVPKLRESYSVTKDGVSLKLTHAFDGEAGELTTIWAPVRNVWALTGFDFPDLVTRAVEPTLDRFAAAWSEGSIESLLEFVRKGDRERFGASMKRMFERRGILDKRPRIEDQRIEPVRAGRVRCQFLMKAALFKTAWEFEGSTWYLSSFGME